MNHLEEYEVLKGNQLHNKLGKLLFKSNRRSTAEGLIPYTYEDLGKVFNNVPYKRLMWKIERIGRLKGGLLKWMKDFFKDREMTIVIKAHKSSWVEVTSSVS